MSQRLFCESVEWCVQYDVNIVRMENHTSICVCSSFRCCSQFSISADFWCDHQLLELTNYRIDSSVPSAICQNGNDKWFLYISIAPVSIRHSCKWSGNVKSTSHSQNAGCWVSSILRHNQSHISEANVIFLFYSPEILFFSLLLPRTNAGHTSLMITACVDVHVWWPSLATCISLFHRRIECVAHHIPSAVHYRGRETFQDICRQ